jgi:hypothetical protein
MTKHTKADKRSFQVVSGGWRGGEEIPPGGWRGGEEIPPGGWRGGEEIPPGGWRAVEDVYRTRDGRAHFTFQFHEVGGHYEVDIVDMPSYGGRDSSLHNTHRLPSDRGGYKVCIGGESSVRSLEQARRWAKSWSEETWKYIKHGEQF